MDTKNIIMLACRRYYNKMRNDPEFCRRKAANSKRHYYRNKYPLLCKIMSEWKEFIIKRKSNTQAKITTFIKKNKNRMLLNIYIDIWKDYEAERLNPINYNPIICSFF